MLEFTCNICGAACRSEIVDREISSCITCGSNVRFRWIVHALSTELFGESLPLREFQESKALRGLGMTDSHPIAEGLSERFSYRNTYFDQEPQFDIMAPPTGEEFDFVIASEVFEHVRPRCRRRSTICPACSAPAALWFFRLRGNRRVTPWNISRICMTGSSFNFSPARS